MNRSRIAYNIHAQRIPDKGKLLAHLDIIQPTALVVLDDVGIALELKARYPNTTVIYRFNGDGGDDGENLLAQKPAEWLDKMIRKVGDNSVVYHTTNETKLNEGVIKWHTDLIKLANDRGVSLCVLNFAVGNPLPEKWVIAKPLLQLLGEHRQHILGCHEYAGGIVTSGLYGGYPDNAGVPPGKAGGLNLIQPDNWPKTVEGVTCYHMGRFKFMVDFCLSIGLKPPRIILTEHGFDDTSDIKAWKDTLRQTHPYQNIRGWRSLINQWREWFGGLGWTAERAMFEQLKWADQTIYQNSPVEAQCIFCWGHSSQEWDQFDVAEAPEFQALMEEYARQGAAFKPTQFAPSTREDVTVSKPINVGESRKGILTYELPVNCRRGPGLKYGIIQTVEPGAVLDVYPDEPVKESDGYRWCYVEVAGIEGWMAVLGDKTFDEYFVKETPVPEIPPVEETPEETPPIEEAPVENGGTARIAKIVAALRNLADLLEESNGE